MKFRKFAALGSLLISSQGWSLGTEYVLVARQWGDQGNCDGKTCQWFEVLNAAEVDQLLADGVCSTNKKEECLLQYSRNPPILTEGFFGRMNLNHSLMCVSLIGVRI